jgi:hypothetical protein
MGSYSSCLYKQEAGSAEATVTALIKIAITTKQLNTPTFFFAVIIFLIFLSDF